MLGNIKNIGKGFLYSGALGLAGLAMACSSGDMRKEYPVEPTTVQQVQSPTPFERHINPTNTPIPTSTPTPTNTPIPTNTPTPTYTPIPTLIPSPTPIPKTTYQLLEELYPNTPSTINGVNMLYSPFDNQIDTTAKILANQIYKHFNGSVVPVGYLRGDIDNDFRDDYVFFYQPISFERFPNYEYDSKKVVGNLIVLTKPDSYYLDGFIFNGSLDPNLNNNFSIKDLTGDGVKELVFSENDQIKNTFYIDTERFLNSKDTDEFHPFVQNISKLYGYEWRDFLRGVKSETTEEAVRKVDISINKAVYNYFLWYQGNKLNVKEGRALLVSNSIRFSSILMLPYSKKGRSIKDYYFKSGNYYGSNVDNYLYGITLVSFPTEIDAAFLINKRLEEKDANDELLKFMYKKTGAPDGSLKRWINVFDYVETFNHSKSREFANIRTISYIDFFNTKSGNFKQFKEYENYLEHDTTNIQREIYDMFFELTFDIRNDKTQYERRLRNFTVNTSNIFDNNYVF